LEDDDIIKVVGEQCCNLKCFKSFTLTEIELLRKENFINKNEKEVSKKIAEKIKDFEEEDGISKFIDKKYNFKIGNHTVFSIFF